MSILSLPASAERPLPTMTRGLAFLFAFCTGAIAANIYYAQPIIRLIAPDVGLSEGAASLIVSLTQIGYALAMLFLVPLSDLVENRRLIFFATSLAAASLLGAALTSHPAAFLLLSLLIGISSVAVQVLIPLAAHLAPDESRGRLVGGIMSGLLLGILLSRPLSSFVADHFGWRATFAGASALMLGILVLFATAVPRYQPAHRSTYRQLLLSLEQLFRRMPVLRERAALQATLFAVFSLFWTAVPIELSRHYDLSQSQIGLFALVGALGAVAAPLAGRLADAGRTRGATLAALALAASSFLPTMFGSGFGVIGLAFTGVALDFAVQMNLVLGQRAIYGLEAASRGRLNALYMTSIFIGGAVGSAVASEIHALGGWLAIAALGATLPLAALIWFAFLSPAARRGD
ncbi:MAG TPA: MFS transporter [Aliidongia sp.]|nr:MFS transporter [Aliidongia sp.]